MSSPRIEYRVRYMGKYGWVLALETPDENSAIETLRELRSAHRMSHILKVTTELLEVDP